MKYATFRYDTVEVENGLKISDEDKSGVPEMACHGINYLSVRLSAYISYCKMSKYDCQKYNYFQPSFSIHCEINVKTQSDLMKNGYLLGNNIMLIELSNYM